MTEQKRRKHSRAQWHDYNEGVYFITVCTKGRVSFLGNVVDTEMNFSETGAVLDSNISAISQHHSDVIISQWVVMPNHFHAIVEITPDIPGNVLPDAISAATGCGPTVGRFDVGRVLQNSFPLKKLAKAPTFTS